MFFNLVFNFKSVKAELENSPPRIYGNERKYQNGRLVQGRRAQQKPTKPSELLQEEEEEYEEECELNCYLFK